VDPRLLTRSIARHLDTFAEHKVDAFTLHDLRRTVSTGLAKLGIPPTSAERCLNMRSPATARRTTPTSISIEARRVNSMGGSPAGVHDGQVAQVSLC